MAQPVEVNEALQQQVQQLGAHVTQAEADLAGLRQENATLQARVRPPVAPPMFEATASQIRDLDMWFLQVRNYLLASGVRSDQLAIQHTVTLFGPMPLRWWQALAPNPNDMPFNNWAEFVAAVRIAFPATMVEAEARQRLYTMQQKPSQSFYGFLASFQAVAARIPNLAEPEKMHCLLRGVLPPIRQELLRVQPASFMAQVAVAAQAAAVMAMSKQGKSWGSQSQGSNRDTAVPMELGQLSAKKPKGPGRKPRQQQRRQAQQQPSARQGEGPPTWGLSPAQLVQHRAEGRCYRCHQPGHGWRDCTGRRPPNGR
jgi:hypothetical protein